MLVPGFPPDSWAAMQPQTPDPELPELKGAEVVCLSDTVGV